jgi:hypothetical protein
VQRVFRQAPLSRKMPQQLPEPWLGDACFQWRSR